MDLLATLRTKINTLPQGDYVAGLRAVLAHIETSFEHLTRGQADNNEQAYTDAIYRTNQAFEGSIKEAYRVLAGKNPDKKTPYEIETYLDDNNVFKPRVLSQFTTYRTQWRNPSTHDYTLSFDENEAFLAITSVSAFACVLIDQISERLAFVQASEDAKTHSDEQGLPDDDVPATLAEVLAVYLTLFNKIALTLPIQSDAQLYGSVQGFLSNIGPPIQVESHVTLVADRPEKADLLVSRGDERVLIELKRSNTRGAVREGMRQLEHSMALAGIDQAILYLYHPAGKLQYYRRPFMDGFVNLLVPVEPEQAGSGASEAESESELHNDCVNRGGESGGI